MSRDGEIGAGDSSSVTNDRKRGSGDDSEGENSEPINKKKLKINVSLGKSNLKTVDKNINYTDLPRNVPVKSRVNLKKN